MVLRAAALVAFVGLALGSFHKFYLDIFRMDTRVLAAQWTELPYRRMPGLKRLFTEVDRRTPPGARILIVTPHPQGSRGYSYAYPRGQFLLTGKHVLPLRDFVTEKPLPVQLEKVDYIACWHACGVPPGFAVTWRSNDGMLLARR